MRNLIDKIFEETGIDAIDEFIKSLAIPEKTQQRYESALRRFIRWTELHQIEDPTKEDITAYKGVVEAIVPKGSAGIQIAVVGNFYDFLARKQLHSDPFRTEPHQSQLHLSSLEDSVTGETAQTDTENKVSEKAEQINLGDIYLAKDIGNIFQCPARFFINEIREGRLRSCCTRDKAHLITGFDVLEYIGKYGDRVAENMWQSVEATMPEETEKPKDPTQDKMSGEKFYTVKEVAEEANLSECAVYDAIYNNKLKSIRVGNRTIRIAQDALDDYISQRGGCTKSKKPTVVFYTAADIAKTLQISVDTVYELVKRKELEASKDGGKLRITPSAFDDYINRENNRI